MRNTTRALGLMLAAGLSAGTACTIKGAPESSPEEGTGNASAEGGAPTEGGKGSTPRAGSSSTGGRPAGEAGSSGSGGAAGEGGEGGAAPTCPGCESGLCLEDGTCVTCLPEDDRCPQGEYCTSDNECAPGCKADGSTCASGSCGDDHNCNTCLSDDECTPGLICSAGQCAAACTSGQEGTGTGCEDGLTCCGLRCTELSVDARNCGACGNACGAGEFCGVAECEGTVDSANCAACLGVTLSNVCSISKVVVILDTSNNDSDGNRATGRAIGKALETQCPSAPAVTEAEQDSVEALNFTTGQPVSGGGELLVVAGGPFFQVVQGYLEREKIAPLYWKVLDDRTEYRRSRDEEVILSLPIAGEHETHDSFIVQFMRDPKSGSLILNAQGFWLSGTVAAAHHVETTILPNLAALDKAWYAYTWEDADGDLAPDDDEITEVASGN